MQNSIQVMIGCCRVAKKQGSMVELPKKTKAVYQKEDKKKETSPPPPTTAAEYLPVIGLG
jgi:hypothetical protein